MPISLKSLSSIVDLECVDKRGDVWMPDMDDNKILSEALESALLYFEEVEEYEKCAHIHKFQKILKESKR